MLSIIRKAGASLVWLGAAHGLKESAAELGKLVELLFFSDFCHNM